MADDGLLINFEVGNQPLQQAVRFKGGRWRDRVRAQRGLKDQSKKDEQNAEDSGVKKALTNGVNGGPQDAERPAKRQRTGIQATEGSTARGSAKKNSTSDTTTSSTPSTRLKQVTSRLFTSNPAPVTVFDAPPQEESEPAAPSNAPLSAETENFRALGLSLRVAQHLSSRLGMKAPTAIQKSTIPQLVSTDSDAFLQAETGSGKTLAYLLPIVQRILALSEADNGSDKEATKVEGARIHRNSGLFAIILAPTRELCKQIAVVLEQLLRCAPWLVSTAVIGGESKKSEKARLRKGVNILIATPGRLTDHLDHTKVLDVDTVRWLVLDEGDRLMEMGFEEDIKTIVNRVKKEPLSTRNKDGVQLDKALPSRRVTILCSATMKMNVQRLGEISLQDAIHIVGPKAALASGDGVAEPVQDGVFSAPSQLKQSYLVVPAKLRLVTLISFLRSVFARRGSVMKAIIFISCADSVNFHFDLLKSPAAGQKPSPEAETGDGQSLTASTVAPAAYLTSPANPAVVLHKLHGSLAQPIRTSTLASFTLTRDPAVLITTDISSRGLDVPAVDLVIEYDPAFAVADHVHRIGRTARAGRPGRAVLFLQPGSEEGYVSLLNSSTPVTPQLYDTVLQKGLAAPVDIPSGLSTTAESEGGLATPAEKQSYSKRAEALQLHLEQRLLARPAAAADGPATPQTAAFRSRHETQKGNSGSKARKDDQAHFENPLLVSARNAFRSHIRAYATHIREERGFFDMTQLHLGHTAKSFALREAPGGIGAGASRRTHKAPASAAAVGADAKNVRRKDAVGRRAAADSSGDEEDGEKAAKDAARRMREKMKEAMNAASEFNIG